SYLSESLLRLRCRTIALYRLCTMRWTVRSSYPVRRHPATTGWIILSCLEAYQPTLVIGGALLTVAAVFLGWRRGGSATAIARALGFTLLLATYLCGLVASVILHEMAHYWAGMWMGMRAKSVFVGMNRVGISHEGGGHLQNLFVSACGPAVALAAAVVAAVITLVAPL